MKSLFSTLGTLALLFSLPGLSAVFTEKAIQEDERASEKPAKEEKVIEDRTASNRESPVCGTIGF